MILALQRGGHPRFVARMSSSVNTVGKIAPACIPSSSKTRHPLIKLPILLSLLCVGLAAKAQVQDSLFLPQNIALPADGATIADARCLDEQLAAPQSGDIYRRITHGEDNAFVIIGSQRFSLDDAIAQRKIAFRGLTPTEREEHPALGGDHLRVAVQNLTN